MRTQQALAVGNGRHILIEHFLGIHNGTYLEKIEIAGSVGMDIAGKLYLYRTAHGSGTILHGHLEYFGKGNDTMLQHTGKGDQLATLFVHAVVDDLVVGVEGRGYKVERLVLDSILDSQFLNIKPIIHLEVFTHMLHIEGIKLGLGLPECLVDLRSLQHLVGMIRTYPKGLPTIHNVFAQSESQTGNTFFCRFVTYRIIVERTEHATHRGIKTGAIVITHHLLQDDCHLLLVDDIARCGHISLGIAIEHRGIHTLDGTRQHLKHLILVLKIRYHIGGIDSCKRLIVGIFEKRAGTDGYRTLRRLEKGEEVGYQCVGQLCSEEMSQDFVIACIAQSYGIEIVALHECIEDIGTKDNCLRNLNRGIVVLIELRMALDDIVEKCQTSALASQGALTYTGEVGILVELHTVEDSYHTDILHVTILHDGIEDDLSVSIHILQFLPGDMAQESRHGEDGTGTEPTAHVIATDVIEHRVVGNLEDIVL